MGREGGGGGGVPSMMKAALMTDSELRQTETDPLPPPHPPTQLTTHSRIKVDWFHIVIITEETAETGLAHLSSIWVYTPLNLTESHSF